MDISDIWCTSVIRVAEPCLRPCAQTDAHTAPVSPCPLRRRLRDGGLAASPCMKQQHGRRRLAFSHRERDGELAGFPEPLPGVSELQLGGERVERRGAAGRESVPWLRHLRSAPHPRGLSVR